MPALTHNRVKNGFNGAIRKNNASMGIKVSRTQGAVGADSLRKKALVGGIGSRSNHIRAAYNRRVLCNCKPKIDTTKPKIFAVTQIANPTTDQTPSFDFSSNEVGTITSNYQFTSTTAAVVGNNTITFSNLVGGTYSDVFVQVTDSVGNVSDKLILDTFVVNDIVPPNLVAKTQIITPGNDSTPSFVFNSNEAGTITSSIAFTSAPDAIAGDNTITFDSLADTTYSGVTVQVTDTAGNDSNVLTLNDFTIDTVVPTIAAKTQITTPGNDSTPSYVFTSNKAGTITTSIANSPAVNAVVGDNTITFNALPDGTYTGVTVQVTDAAGNVSNVLTLDDFEIQTTLPTISATTQITTPTNDTTPSFVFTSTRAGTITTSIAISPVVNAVVGNNTITFDSLADTTYSGVTVQVTDTAGNDSNVLTLNDFTIDTVVPTIAAKTQITTPGNDSTPSYVFTSNKAGTITTSIANSPAVNAVVGDNTITFNALPDGTYTGVTVQVTDAAGNVSNVLTLDDFTVDANTECLTLNTLVNIVNSAGNKYVFNGGTAYDSTKKYGLYTTTYTFKDIPEAHPLAILNNGNTNITYIGDASKKFNKSVSGTTNDGTYDFYHGDITVTVSGDFGNVSTYCYYHGYMGGENLLKYKSTCAP